MTFNVKKLEKFSKEIHFDLNSVVATLMFKRDFESLKSFPIDNENITRENVFAYAVLSCSHLYQDGDFKLAESTLERCSALGLDTDTLNKIVMQFEYLVSENLQITEIKLDRKSLSLCNLEHKVVDVSQYEAPQALLNKLETYDYGDRSFYYRQKSSSDVKVLDQVFKEGEYGIDWIPQFQLLKRYERKLNDNGVNTLIVDGGANIGASAAFFCQKFNNSSVISIEPDVSNREILAANVAGLKVFIFEGALSSKVETRSFIDPNHGEWAYRFCMEDSAGSARDLGEVQCLGIVDILSLSQFKNHKLLIVKLDIEGGESLLFEENFEWLDETPLLVIELHDWMLLNNKPSRSFQKAILGKDFDLFTKGENLFCFNRKILGN
ncbi:FkbM family methyltransferase [Alteromonas macleodii]|uniref:FkbM family methyltransferase n=1 Tax=Alteromonas macleodii TaxID=28108 RepID=UPI0036698976